MRDRLRALLALAAVPGLAVVAGAPTTLLGQVSPGAGTPPLAPLLAVLGLVAWCCTGWLLLVLVLTGGERLPGLLGRLSERLSARLAPAAIRSLARAALGTSVAVAVLAGPTAAFAASPTPVPVPVLAGSTHDPLDWPGLGSGLQPPTAVPTPATSTARPRVTPVQPVRSYPPAAPTPAAPDPAATAAATSGRSVVVRQGDTLWTLAAEELGPHATRTQVAQAWPRWWAANRAVIGADPDVIHPGTRLTVPHL